MKKIFLTLTFALFCTVAVNAQFGKLNSKHIDAAAKGVKAFTLTDEEVAAYCQEYIDWMDAHNPVCSVNDKDAGMKAIAQRLAKIVEGHDDLNGKKLDIKAYYVIDVNAFACANGSVRVFAGLMDLMTDDEIYGIIGHEIGHVANKDSKEAFKTALLTSALKDAASSVNGTVQTLSDSQLGALGEALANAQFSQKQEYAADEYGFNFLKNAGKDPKAMASSLRVLQKLEEDANMDNSKTKQLFSSHPNTAKRAERLDKMK